MKNDKKHLSMRRQWLALGAALALGMMVSATGFAKPVLGSDSWITYTYFNAQGQIVGGNVADELSRHAAVLMGSPDDPLRVRHGHLLHRAVILGIDFLSRPIRKAHCRRTGAGSLFIATRESTTMPVP